MAHIIHVHDKQHKLLIFIIIVSFNICDKYIRYTINEYKSINL